MSKRVVYWTCSKEMQRRIMKYFGIQGTTVNGESDADRIPPEKEEKFQEGIAKNFYKIRYK